MDLKHDGAVVLPRNVSVEAGRTRLVAVPGRTHPVAVPGRARPVAAPGYARPIARVSLISMTTRSGLGVGVRPYRSA